MGGEERSKRRKGDQMNVTQVQDDSGIWRKGTAGNPEMIDLIRQMQKWDIGKTYEVTLDKPYKSFRDIIRREFGETKTVNIKKRDDAFTSWYVRFDVKQAQVKRGRKKKVIGDNNMNLPVPEGSNPPEITNQTTNN